MVVELVKIGNKIYREFTYEEAKKNLLGKHLELNLEDAVCEHCINGCEDNECAKDNLMKESFICTGVTENGIMFYDHEVPYIMAIKFFRYMDGNPVGIEVKVEDVVKAKPTRSTKTKDNKVTE